MKRMKILKKAIPAYCLLFSIFLAGCAGENSGEPIAEDDYVSVTLFVDVSFWHAPRWDTEPGTITGDISRETGLIIDPVERLEDPVRQLSLMLVNDELPDVITVTDETVRSQLVSSGKVWKLDEFLETYKPDSHLLKEYPEDILYELEKRDGGWYALPSHIISQDAVEIWKPSSECYEELFLYEDSRTVFWNNALLESLGLKAEDLDTEGKILGAFAQAKQEGIQPLMIDGDAWYEYTLPMLADRYGAEYVDGDGNYIDIVQQQETKDVLRFLNTVMREGYAQPEQMTLSNDELKQKMDEGNVLCFMGNMANISFDSREWTASGPLQIEGKTPVWGRNMRASTGWMNTFVSKDCSHPEEIAAWIDYMTSDEGMMRWCWGEEGVDYVMEDGLVFLTEEGVQATMDSEHSGVSAWWMFNNAAWERSVRTAYKPGTLAEAEAEAKTAYASDPRVKAYDVSLVSDLLAGLPRDDEYRQMEEQIDSWKEEQIPRVILASDEAKFEAEYTRLISGLEDRGIDHLNTFKNEQYKKNCEEYGRKIESVNPDEK